MYNLSLLFIGMAVVVSVVAFIADFFKEEILFQIMQAFAKIFTVIGLLFWAFWLVEKLILTFR